MKKKLVSAVVALSIFGCVGIASAGSVTTKTDTNISLSGFTQMYFDWANNQGFLANTANPEFIKANTKSSAAQTSFGSTANFTRLSLALENKSEGIKGLIEGDFWGGGANISTDGNGNFRLRHAYFVKEFCQEGCNYTPWLLIGQTFNSGFYVSYTMNGPCNIAGSSNGPTNRIPQVGFGVKFDLGSVKLNPQIAAQDLLTTFISQSGFDSYRSTMPGLGVRLPVEFNTGLGKPASFYADFQWQNLKLTKQTAGIDSSNQNSYEFGGGLELPIYFVSFKTDAHYSKGFTKYDLLYGNVMPPSYYLNGTSIEKVSATAWDAMLKVDFNSLAQVPITIAGGYSQVVFGNLTTLSNTTTTAYARKASTIFVNMGYNLTKSATLGLEYDRNKTYYVGSNNDPNNGRVSNQVFFVGTYKF
ncbi:hypothetical protein DESACE_00915 [Desulfurella acetivorans A63]|nr:hypothetical protein DESACE_00915 [Desulfurella acetivorans A63]